MFELGLSVEPERMRHRKGKNCIERIFSEIWLE